MLRFIPSTSKRLPCLLRPLVHKPRPNISIVARPPRTRFSMLPRQVRQYSSESGHSKNEPASERPRSCSDSSLSVMTYIVSYALATLGMMYYFSLPKTIPEMQPTDLDVYDQPATPQRTRQELARQECLNEYRSPLFNDVRKRCEHLCTQNLVPCALVQELHAIYAREIGSTTKSLMNIQSGQHEPRSTREELRWLEQLDKERSSMFWKLQSRCQNLCSDSSSPCPIWQEVYKIRKRELDAQAKEGRFHNFLRTLVG